MTVLPVTGAQIGYTHLVQISANQALDGETESIAYFCSCYLPDVTKALEMYANLILSLIANFSQWRINFMKELVIMSLSALKQLI